MIFTLEMDEVGALLVEMGSFLEGQGEFVGIGVGGELVLFEEQLLFAGC